MNRYLMLLGLIVFTGCASAPRPQAPSIWPATWDDRKPYVTEYAIIYARTPAAADETERLVAAIAREFTRRTGARPTTGLIIVNDIDDSRIGALPLDSFIPSPLIPQEIRSLQIDRMEMILASPVELTAITLDGFPPAARDSIAWAIALPTHDRLEITANKLLDSTLQNPSLGPLERALITGFKPMFAACVADTVAGAGETTLYKQFCDSQPDWAAQKRTEELTLFAPTPPKIQGLPTLPQSNTRP